MFEHSLGVVLAERDLRRYAGRLVSEPLVEQTKKAELRFVDVRDAVVPDERLAPRQAEVAFDVPQGERGSAA